MKQEILFEKLMREASGGANMRVLETEIDKQGRRLTDVEREEAWLYAWALRRRVERRLLLGSDGRGDQRYGYAGDAGAG
jgi:hypothetical protein